MSSSKSAAAAIHTDTAQEAVPWPGPRDYESAIEALNSLQSNAAFVEAKRKAGPQFVDGLPLEIENLHRIGHKPEDLNKLNVIHVTGTKGKGSTSAFCDSLLRRASQSCTDSRPRKVGLYTSPHMTAARERIRINGLPLEADKFAKYFFEVWDLMGRNSERKVEDAPLRPLYFRFLTTLCFHVFLREAVDAVILEVGIGGRYDSTNIVPEPVVTGITSLGIDHTHMLGNTIEEIAWQKGGIYKAGVPAFSVNQAPSALEVLRKCARDEKASSFEVVQVPSDLSVQLPRGLGLPGDHQSINATLALALVRSFLRSVRGRAAFPGGEKRSAAVGATQLSPDEVEALQDARWPGRCQIVPSRPDGRGSTWFLDGAHTTDSLDLCLRWFCRNVQARSEAAKKTLVFNCTNGRSARSLLSSMLNEVERSLSPTQSGASEGDTTPYSKAREFFDHVYFCTNITYANGGSRADLMSKAVDPSDLSALTVQRELQTAWNELLNIGPDDAPHARVKVLPSIQDAMQLVSEQEQTGASPNVLVTGSLHLVGGVMAHLQDRKLLDEALISVHQERTA